MVLAIIRGDLSLKIKINHDTPVIRNKYCVLTLLTVVKQSYPIVVSISSRQKLAEWLTVSLVSCYTARGQIPQVFFAPVSENKPGSNPWNHRQASKKKCEQNQAWTPLPILRLPCPSRKVNDEARELVGCTCRTQAHRDQELDSSQFTETLKRDRKECALQIELHEVLRQDFAPTLDAVCSELRIYTTLYASLQNLVGQGLEPRHVQGGQSAMHSSAVAAGDVGAGGVGLLQQRGEGEAKEQKAPEM